MPFETFLPEAATIGGHVEMMADAGIDIEKPGYRRGWQFLGMVATEMGVGVDYLEVAHWASNLGVMRAVDELVDKQHQPDIQTEIYTVAQGVPIEGVTPAEASIFAEVLGAYPPERRPRQLADLSSLPYFAERRRAARNVPELITANTNEAQMFARVLQLDEASQSVRDDLPARQRFNKWVIGFSRAGYLADSFADLQEDRNADNVRVPESNFRARVAIARVAIPEAVRTIRQTPPKAFGSMIRISVLNTIEKAA